MKTLYFDCYAGISGDMLLGALCGLGMPWSVLTQMAERLGMSPECLSLAQVNKAGLAAWQVRVQPPPATQHRHLADIAKILHAAELSATVRTRALAIFQRLATAEAKVHGVSVEQVHFHEVGAWDAIMDIVGACAGFEFLGIEQFICSPLHTGTGFVKMAHGTFPVPPPAVAELLHGVPMYATERRGELVTPTGAAIVREVCQTYGPMPKLRVAAVGYGAGTRDYPDFPNALRLWLGETETTSLRSKQTASASDSDDSDSELETLVLLETNLDDATPELCGYVLEQALAAGALDCYLTSVQMKKNRPGVLVSVLCRTAQADALSNWLLRETGTLGVRQQTVLRRTATRESVTVDTIWGPVDVKVGRAADGVLNGKPEYEQCRRYALAAQVPLREVTAAAWYAWRQQNATPEGKSKKAQGTRQQ